MYNTLLSEQPSWRVLWMMAGEPTELVFILITSSASVALMLMLWWKWPKPGRLFHLKEYVQEPQVWKNGEIVYFPIAYIGNYWIRLLYDVKNYRDLGSCYRSSVELYSFCSCYVLGSSSAISSSRNVWNVPPFCTALPKEHNLIPRASLLPLFFGD